MALTLKRWVVIAILACATIAVWQLPSPGKRERSGSRAQRILVPEYGYVRQYGWPDITTRLETTAFRLRVLQLRDSVFTPRELADTTQRFRILVDDQFPDSIRRTVADLFTDTWRSYNAGTRFPVIAAIVQDTGRTLDGAPLATTSPINAEVFPPDSSTPVCRVLARIRVNLRGRAPNVNVEYARKNMAQALMNQSSGRAALGPCAMYATFGRPGRGVAAWLRLTAWRPGRSIDWSRQSPAWNDDYYDRYKMPRPLVDFTGQGTRAWQMRYELSDDAIACVGGESARCVSGLERPAVEIPGESAWSTAVIDVRAPTYFWRYNSFGSLGPASGQILSDMVHELGRERFQRFWSSSDTLPDAFRRAAGTPLAAWLQQWARRAYGSDVLGPLIPERASLSGVLILIAGFAAAAVFASRRRVA